MHHFVYFTHHLSFRNNRISLELTKGHFTGGLLHSDVQTATKHRGHDPNPMSQLIAQMRNECITLYISPIIRHPVLVCKTALGFAQLFYGQYISPIIRRPVVIYTTALLFAQLFYGLGTFHPSSVTPAV